MWDALVIGGGAAGMMAAGTAAERGLRVCLLEKNAVLGKKLRITGKGRCNVTNRCDVRTMIASVPKNGRFLFGAASRFTPDDTVAFFEAAQDGAGEPRVPRLRPCGGRGGGPRRLCPPRRDGDRPG